MQRATELDVVEEGPLVPKLVLAEIRKREVAQEHSPGVVGEVDETQLMPALLSEKDPRVSRWNRLLQNKLASRIC